MPKSIPSGLSSEHIKKALRDLDEGIEHPFGSPTGYVLIDDDKNYAPKAVVGIAFRHFSGEILPPSVFSGGESPGHANFVLRKLGFTVVEKERDDGEKTESGRRWSEQEVQLVVSDYFVMLESELLEKPYKKSEHRKRLLLQLNERSNGSVEFKHQNISAVLAGLGFPYIEGYKPRGNYQNLLAEEIGTYLDQHYQLLDRLVDVPTINPTQTKKVNQPDLSKVIESPPEKIVAPKSLQKPWLTRRARKINFAERDAKNRQLGKLGEQFVVDLEVYRLSHMGRDDLAKKIQWVARDFGDGLGFDVLSFDDTDDSERMLEVKTTGFGKFVPFFVTANELRCSEDIPDQFHLYRVFDFSRNPRAFILHGSLNDLCQLDPVLYRASV